MVSSVEAVFYDGVVSRPQSARISPIDAQSVLIRYGDQYEKQRRYMYEDMTLIGALGKIKPIIEMKDDARLELQQALPDWFMIGNKKTYHSIWKLERSPSLILFSIVFVAVFAFAVVKWGVPSASHHIARVLPVDTMNQLGEEAEKQVFRMTEKSTLPAARQEQIRKQYLDSVAEGKPAKLLFRAGGEIGANALALPNNTIILTDELVKLTKDDREILGVLAHEQGHIVERHSLQQAIASLGFSAILIAVTGDSSDLFSSLPVALVGAGYSRDFESEADLYALKQMNKKNVPVKYFSDFLQRLSEENSEEKSSNAVTEFLSSHPATKERIAQVKKFEKQLQTQ